MNSVPDRTEKHHPWFPSAIQVLVLCPQCCIPTNLFYSNQSDLSRGPKPHVSQTQTQNITLESNYPEDQGISVNLADWFQHLTKYSLANASVFRSPLPCYSSKTRVRHRRLQRRNIWLNGAWHVAGAFPLLNEVVSEVLMGSTASLSLGTHVIKSKAHRSKDEIRLLCGCVIHRHCS